MRRVLQAILAIPIAIFIFSVAPASAAPINLALGGTATQSSTYLDNETAYGAYLGIDGIVSAVDSNDGLTHTKRESGAWWQVDLGEDFNISIIEIYNRTADYSGRINPSFVYIIKDGSPVWTGVIDITGIGYSWTFITPVVGQIVKIQLDQQNTDPYLHLKEVEVWGASIPPVTTPEPATMLLLSLGLIGLAGVGRKV